MLMDFYRELFQDKMRLDWLEEQFKNKIICRDSEIGRGWRLHETTREGASDNVRGAIDKAMELFNEKKEN